MLKKTLALSVHLFTSLGIVAALLSIIAISRSEWREAMLWLWVCFAIDGLDGTFARLFKVKETLPDWDGKTIDYVIDFCTYAVVPAYFLYASPMLSEPFKLPLAAIVLLTSAMYYGKMGMVSADNYFVGFPVLWNFVIFYQFFVFNTSQTTTIISTLLLCVLHFVPIKVPYPSQSLGYRWLHMAIIVLSVIANALVLYEYPNSSPIWTWISMAFLAYVTVWAAWATWKLEDKN